MDNGNDKIVMLNIFDKVDLFKFFNSSSIIHLLGSIVVNHIS